MTDIAISRDVPLVELEAFLSGLLPGVAVDVRSLDAPASWRKCDVAITKIPNESEFPCGLSVGVVLRDPSSIEDWLRELARKLSIEFACRTTCGGEGFGDDSSPYWSVVWDCGVAYLADDCGTVLCDEAGGPLRLVRPLPELQCPRNAIDLRDCVQLSVE